MVRQLAAHNPKGPLQLASRQTNPRTHRGRLMLGEPATGRQARQKARGVWSELQPQLRAPQQPVQLVDLQKRQRPLGHDAKSKTDDNHRIQPPDSHC